MTILSTRDTQSPIYQDALTIRREVFVEGQGVPLSIEVDDKEDKCLYLVYYKDKQAVATCRLFPFDDKQVILQRMAVRPACQGQNLGKVLLQEALTIAKAEGFSEMTLHSQVHAQAFYHKQGFESYGEVYEEAGIAHINMRQRL